MRLRDVKAPLANAGRGSQPQMGRSRYLRATTTRSGDRHAMRVRGCTRGGISEQGGQVVHEVVGHAEVKGRH